VNLSNIWDSTINVKEPRLVGPPGNRAGCVDPQAPTDPRDCQNKNVVVAAWGTETNVSANTVSAENLDIFVTRTTDQAASFEPVVVLAGGDNIQGESQIRITPAGTDIYAVWTEQDTMGAINSMYAQITEQEIPPPAMSNLGSGGCSYNPKGKFDPMLPVLLLVSIIYLAGRFSLASRPCVKQGRRKE
jgi:hypothetical protein